MKILGIQCGHNASAALLIDGKVVGAAQEERFTGRKNQQGFPAKSIAYLVKAHLHGDPQMINHVSCGGYTLDLASTALNRNSGFTVFDHIRENYEVWRPHLYDGKIIDGTYWRDMYLAGKQVNHSHNLDVSCLVDMPYEEAKDHFCKNARPEAMKRLFNWSGSFDYIDHHLCHAYYALYGAPLPGGRTQDAMVLTADSWGDGKNWSASTVNEDGSLALIDSGTKHEVGRIYRFVTLIMGMVPLEHEYKVMGLSAYSKSRRHIEMTERVFYECLDFRDGQFVSDHPLKDSYFDLRDRLEGHRFDNIAAALQNWSTALTRAWIKHWMDKTGKSIVCYSGGLSMNIKSNGDMLDLPGLKHFSVPASGGDETTSIGACFAASLASKSPTTHMTHVYLGDPDAFADEENDWRTGVARADQALDDYTVIKNVGAEQLATLLAADQILARCQGPMEFGARSLGNRAILANPSNANNLKRINDAIKNRDFWMPFTPSILAEHANEYLVNPTNQSSPFMTIGFPSRNEKRADMIAALHPGDFSARPQFVERETNPEYWELINAFHKKTGIALLLNTSLNLHGEPMNATVADAARTMALSDIDFLALPNDVLLIKSHALGTFKSIIG
ncbi:MAG: hypothetical protein NUV50_11770 [Rhodospirillales bacterium]|nr:hypothetical protein [Rhodospirillales bacterium]